MGLLELKRSFPEPFGALQRADAGGEELRTSADAVGARPTTPFECRTPAKAGGSGRECAAGQLRGVDIDHP